MSSEEAGWSNIQQDVYESYLQSLTSFHIPTESTIKLYICQFVSLLFILRYFKLNNYNRCSFCTGMKIALEVLLFFSVNAACLYVIINDGSQWITLDLKYAIAIQVAIIYGLSVVDLLVALASSTTTHPPKAQPLLNQNVILGTRLLPHDPAWVKYLRHLNDDFLKIILSYNFIIINDLQISTAGKLVELAMKLICLCIMLRYEFHEDGDSVDDGVDDASNSSTESNKVLETQEKV
ncbi:hypothetical protein KGF57_004155 [Candida theae]|uniref:Uncharacterized protein n=1 Tax=Candida theae TaxID=1198502 RepID=A0AAD5BBR2_9ASCO|nr:uncharacterized protein KGF57_004155 [Candida theae]KAI5952191.1 hypothetical protein KGF57_004155 [Candida theae]